MHEESIMSYWDSTGSDNIFFPVSSAGTTTRRHSRSTDGSCSPPRHSTEANDHVRGRYKSPSARRCIRSQRRGSSPNSKQERVIESLIKDLDAEKREAIADVKIKYCLSPRSSRVTVVSPRSSRVPEERWRGSQGGLEGSIRAKLQSEKSEQERVIESLIKDHDAKKREAIADVKIKYCLSPRSSRVTVSPPSSRVPEERWRGSQPFEENNHRPRCLNIRTSVSDLNLNDVRQTSAGRSDPTLAVGGLEGSIRAKLQSEKSEQERVMESLIKNHDAEKLEAIAVVKTKYRKKWKGVPKLFEEEVAAIGESSARELAALEEQLNQSEADAAAATSALRDARGAAKLEEEQAELKSEVRYLRDKLDEMQSSSLTELKHVQRTAEKQLSELDEAHRVEMRQHFDEIEYLRDAYVELSSDMDKKVADLEEELRDVELEKSEVEAILDGETREFKAVVDSNSFKR